MIVGAALIELRVHGSRSLKEKRGVVRAIQGRLRSRFNVSVAEVGGQDTWQRALLGLVVAGNDARGVRSLLERMLRFVEELHLAEVVASDVELVPLEHRGPGEEDDGFDAELAAEMVGRSRDGGVP